MKRKILVGFAVLALIIVAQTYGMLKNRSQNSDIYATLDTLPSFDRSSVEGHYFLLHFWAKWCAPCTEEIPHLVNFATIAQEKVPGLQIVGVSLDESLEVSKTILPNQGKSLPSNFHLLLDKEHAVAEGLGSYQYPETYLYDPQGRVLEKWVGVQKWDSPEVIEYFRNKIVTKP